MEAAPRVVACARELTHAEMRSLACSAPPSARLATVAARQFISE
jgi:hypothetical protein